MQCSLVCMIFFVFIEFTFCADCHSHSYKAGCWSKLGGIVLEDLLITDRDGSSGNKLDWKNFQNSISSLICRCQKVAREKHYKVFGIQYFGECWATKKDMTIVARSLENSNDCINGFFKICRDENMCVGRSKSIYLYTLGTADATINGGYNEWSSWSLCSSTCVGGVQERSRLCNKPQPSNGGMSCDSLGDAEEIRECGTLSCNQDVLEATCKVTSNEEFHSVTTNQTYTPYTPFCAVMNKKPAENHIEYKVSAYMYCNQEEQASRIGLMVNAKNTQNYEFVYIHLRSPFYCYTTGRIIDGKEDWKDMKSDQCNRSFQAFRWIHLEAVVTSTIISFYADNQFITSWKPTLPGTGRGGIIVRNGFMNENVFFQNLEIL